MTKWNLHSRQSLVGEAVYMEKNPKFSNFGSGITKGIDNAMTHVPKFECGNEEEFVSKR